ncbi:MAG: aldehyde dehydrogenase family protein, partial [Corynebacterium sp.]|nr:aldehyde dehydrogenase family protein [Corynebacterium sp.]
EAYELANATEYGLAAYAYSQDPSRLWRLSDNLEFGLIGFNAGVVSNAAAPFGGVKHSGLGREGGAEGTDEYSTVQYLGVADPYQR